MERPRLPSWWRGALLALAAPRQSSAADCTGDAAVNFKLCRRLPGLIVSAAPRCNGTWCVQASPCATLAGSGDEVALRYVRAAELALNELRIAAFADVLGAARDDYVAVFLTHVAESLIGTAAPTSERAGAEQCMWESGSSQIRSDEHESVEAALVAGLAGAFDWASASGLRPPSGMDHSKLPCVIHELRKIENRFAKKLTPLADGRCQTIDGQIYEQSCKSFVYGSTFFHSWLQVVSFHAPLREWLLAGRGGGSASEPDVLVLGASLGWQVMLSALTFGTRSWGIELLRERWLISLEVAERCELEVASVECGTGVCPPSVDEVQTAPVVLLNGDATKVHLPTSLKLVYMTDLAWDEAVRLRVVKEIMKQWPGSQTTVVSNVESAWKLFNFQTVAENQVPVSWQEEQHFYYKSRGHPGVPYNGRGDATWTPLHRCAADRTCQHMAWLLEAFPDDVSMRNSDGRTPLHQALLHEPSSASRQQGFVSHARLLVGARADVEAADGAGRPALSLAKSLALAEVLLEEGADANRADSKGRTALFDAASRGDAGRAKLLVAYGANASVVDADGRTALLSASSLDVARVFLELPGIEIDAADKKGRSLLHIWAGAGNAELTKGLLGLRASVSKVDAAGSPSLRHAGGHLEVAALLLEAGASPTTQNEGGEAALLGLLPESRLRMAASEEEEAALSGAAKLQVTPAASINALAEKLALAQDDVVYDLGSGLGGLALQLSVVAQSKEIVGIEYCEARHKLAQGAADLLASRGHRSPRFVRGDVRSAELGDATIIFALPTHWKDDTWKAMVTQILASTKLGTRLVTRSEPPMTLPGATKRLVPVAWYQLPGSAMMRDWGMMYRVYRVASLEETPAAYSTTQLSVTFAPGPALR